MADCNKCTAILPTGTKINYALTRDRAEVSDKLLRSGPVIDSGSNSRRPYRRQG